MSWTGSGFRWVDRTETEPLYPNPTPGKWLWGCRFVRSMTFPFVLTFFSKGVVLVLVVVYSHSLQTQWTINVLFSSSFAARIFSLETGSEPGDCAGAWAELHKNQDGGRRGSWRNWDWKGFRGNCSRSGTMWPARRRKTLNYLQTGSCTHQITVMRTRGGDFWHGTLAA